MTSTITLSHSGIAFVLDNKTNLKSWRTINAIVLNTVITSELTSATMVIISLGVAACLLQLAAAAVYQVPTYQPPTTAPYQQTTTPTNMGCKYYCPPGPPGLPGTVQYNVLDRLLFIVETYRT